MGRVSCIVLAGVLGAAGLGAAGLGAAGLGAQQGVAGPLAGNVFHADGTPAGGAAIVLLLPDGSRRATTADAAGHFAFSGAVPLAGTLQSTVGGESATLPLQHPSLPVRLLLHPQNPGGTGKRANGADLQFSDAPTFAVAGVTDWTAVGGHGSDSTLRTSEDLTRDTVVLERAPAAPADAAEEQKLQAALAAAPQAYQANRALGLFYLRAERFSQALPPLETAARLHGDAAPDESSLALACAGIGDLRRAKEHAERALSLRGSADDHRLLGELDERTGEPLAAVEQLRRAAAMDPTEQNSFAWASELLLHRAIWQAEQVFAQAAVRFPASVRLQTGWGSALFAGARYPEAAQHLCRASDLDPHNRESYLLLGKAALAAPEPLPCAGPTLDRFLRLYPHDAEANYDVAMLLLRQSPAVAGGEEQPANTARAEALLRTAVALDPHFAPAYLQLGILEAAQHHAAEALTLYREAVAADPTLAEAHFRLGVALDRSGNHAAAQVELQRHEQLAAAQADAVEQQRRQIKQFLVTTNPKP